MYSLVVGWLVRGDDFCSGLVERYGWQIRHYPYFMRYSGCDVVSDVANVVSLGLIFGFVIVLFSAIQRDLAFARNPSSNLLQYILGAHWHRMFAGMHEHDMLTWKALCLACAGAHKIHLVEPPACGMPPGCAILGLLVLVSIACAALVKA